MAPCLAESWSASEDGLSYDFVLRDGAKFHNGDPVTAEDVKFSFERYRGANQAADEGAGGGGRDARSAARPLQAERAVARLSDLLFERHRRRLDRAEEICREGRRRRLQEGARSAPAPTNSCRSPRASSWCSKPSTGIGARPRASSASSCRSIPDETTRLAALKRGEVDIAYSIRGELAEELRTHARAHPEVGGAAGDQLDLFPRAVGPEIAVARSCGCGRPPTSRSTARRMNEALFLGGSKISNSIIPEHASNSTGSRRAAVYDPAKAKKLLAEAGYPNGFDAGAFYCDCVLLEYRRGGGQQSAGGRHPRQAAADRARRLHLRPTPTRNTSRTSCAGGSGAFGNAATRLDGVRRQGRHQRLRQLSRHRRALPAAGRRARPRRSARRSSTRCSSWCTRRRSTRRSGNSPSSTASARGSASRRSA